MSFWHLPICLLSALHEVGGPPGKGVGMLRMLRMLGRLEKESPGQNSTQIAFSDTCADSALS